MTAAPAALPQYSVDDIAEALEGLSPEEQVELLGLLNADGDIWYSLPGAQSTARYSEADITGYGGAAGGGKTDLACGLALVDHDLSTILRAEVSQLEGVKERLESILGSRKGFNGQANIWKLGPGRRIRFGGFANPGDEKRHQGIANDLLVFDEAAEMREAQVRFVIAWNRSAKKRRTRVLMTLNPPQTPEGRWIVAYFGPWLDKRHALYPTAPGALRWATAGPDGKDYWLTDGRSFVWSNKLLPTPLPGEPRPVYDYDPELYRRKMDATRVITPMSRTFIPAKLGDNPFLTRGPEYMARLQGLPEPMRSQMLNGDFEAGMEDHEWQVIPTAWVNASMERWKARGSESAGFRKPGPMDSMGVDVAMGGKDQFVIARRHGTWFDDLIRWPGRTIKSGAEGAGKVIMARRDRAPVHVDIIGWGSDTFGALVSNQVQAVPINAANGSTYVTKAGMRCANKRAELIWKLREALDPDGPDPIDLPDDAALALDLTAYRYKPTRGGILIEAKEDMKKRLGRSPDDGDAVAMALEDTMKVEQVIDALDVAGYGGAGDYDRMNI